MKIILIFFLYIIPVIALGQLQFRQIDTTVSKKSIIIKDFTMFEKGFCLIERKYNKIKKVEEYKMINGQLNDIEADSIYTGYNINNGREWIILNSTKGKNFFYSYSILNGNRIIAYYQDVITRLIVELPELKAKKLLFEIW